MVFVGAVDAYEVIHGTGWCGAWLIWYAWVPRMTESGFVGATHVEESVEAFVGDAHCPNGVNWFGASLIWCLWVQCMHMRSFMVLAGAAHG